MQRYSLIVITDETAPIRRYDVEKRVMRRWLWAGGALIVALIGVMADYVRVRLDQVELTQLRVETAQQREQISTFEDTLGGVESNLQRLREFERKVRIIANLPGSAGSGGEEISAVTLEAAGDLGQGGAPLDDLQQAPDSLDAPPDRVRDDKEDGEAQVGVLRRDAERLGIVAEARSLSLAALIDELESKRKHLESTPAIWPTKGWLTSRFGYRVSPFTGARQFHSGIDIAGGKGTAIVAPARGKVTFSGKRGPMGNSLIIDHGFGVRTLYGHADDLLVERGAEVERGMEIATLGSSGRSTGPHLHYVVEVDGKAKNPLDYIFD